LTESADHRIAEERENASRIIVGVPGPWKERRDLIEALLGVHEGAYLFAGVAFMEVATKLFCRADWYEHDEDLRTAFARAGQGKLSDTLLDAVGAHESTVYLVFDDAGYETARTAARFAAALLRAGGIAVKVETAGVAHSPERWLEACNSEESFDIYGLFIVLVGGDDCYYSCGMQNFALPDTQVPASLGPERGAELLNFFNMYQLVEAPDLNEGHTFSLAEDAPRFRLKREPYDSGYEEPLYNPHGLWVLSPVEAPPAKPRRRWGFFR
jgi:hypothetical protein